jgi:hypothetical protein
MTVTESFMLAFSFGTSLGYVIGNVIIMICRIAERFREKREDKKARMEDTVM